MFHPQHARSAPVLYRRMATVIAAPFRILYDI
jgi:hypothetical protein